MFALHSHKHQHHVFWQRNQRTIPQTVSGRPGRMSNHLTNQDQETKAVHKPTEVKVFKVFQTAEQQ